MKRILFLLGSALLANAAETTTTSGGSSGSSSTTKTSGGSSGSSSSTTSTNPAYNDEFNDESHPDTPWTYLDHGAHWGTKSAKVVPGNVCGTGNN